MQLEDSTGKVSVPMSVNEVTDILDRLGKELDHCILSDGDIFIQAAGSDLQLVVEYGDSSGHYEATGLHSAGTVKDLFSAFFKKDDSWKTMVVFSPANEASSGPSKSAEGSDDDARDAWQKNPKNSLLDSITRELKSNVSNMVRRGVRNVFRKFK